MSYDENHSTFDPYRSFEQSLKTGDVINRWILSRPRRRIVQLLKGQRVLDVCVDIRRLQFIGPVHMDMAFDRPDKL